MKQYQLVMFDLDGVLLDSRLNMQASWQAVRQGLNIDIPFENYFQEIGKPFADIMDILGLGSRAREAEKLYMTASMNNTILLHWFEGVETMLTRLIELDVKLAIVTSKDRQRTVRVVERLPVFFSTIQTPAQGLRGKPAPDHLLIACAHANVDPSHSLFVGDMKVDQQAALRAQIDFAHAAWGYGEVGPDCTYVIKTPIEVLSTIQLANE